MKKWVKWALVGGGALLLVKAVKGGSLLGGLTGGADAPGVELGDVKYAVYKITWDAAKAKGAATFYYTGERVFTETETNRKWSYRYTYTWDTFTGAYVSKQKNRVK